MTRTTKAQQAERAEAIDTLRELLPPGSRVYTVLRHVSRSGMQRRIDLYLIDPDGLPFWLSGLAARAMGERVHVDGGIVVGGAGMDMGFSLVYNLSRTLYRDGHSCAGDAQGKHWTKGCPSNDHINDRGAHDYSPNRYHSDGGYALRQVWL